MKRKMLRAAASFLLAFTLLICALPLSAHAVCLREFLDPELERESLSDEQREENLLIITDFLRTEMQLPDSAVAAILANMDRESSLNPRAIDESGNFFGLCQWTYSTRKAGLLQCARKCTLSIGDAGPQIVFLREELQSSFRATLEKLLAAKSVREASDAFMLGFEKPKNQSEENQARRAELGQKYFDQFADHAAGKDDGSTEDTALASMLVALPRVHLIELKACLSDALNIVNSALSGSD